MKPTIGRIVYYKSYGTPNGEYLPDDRAAIITAVHSDTEVSLCVINPTGFFFPQHVMQDTTVTGKSGTWDWMPFQKGQAQKTDQLADEVLKHLGQQAVVNGIVNDVKGGK